MASSDSRLVPALAGRALAYVGNKELDVAAPATRAHQQSGLVIGMKTGAVERVQALKRCGYSQPVVVDVRAWSSQIASVDVPLDLPSDGLFPVTIDTWAEPILRTGAAALTPSRFVRTADWPALKAVIAASNTSCRPGIITLIATDAAMLDAQNIKRFVDISGEARGVVAFLFASSQAPFEKRGRASAMRSMLQRFPRAILLGVDVLVGLDALVNGAQATAIGVTGGLRRPRRPGDPGGPPAKGWQPGMFLRQLWEQRSPAMYADWYAGSASPTCDQCGGRKLDTFGNDPFEKKAILRHAVHTWLDVLSELHALPTPERATWLAGQRIAGFEAHAELRHARVTVEADRLLRQLVELDDPQRRLTTPSGTWRSS